MTTITILCFVAAALCALCKGSHEGLEVITNKVGVVSGQFVFLLKNCARDQIFNYLKARQ